MRDIKLKPNQYKTAKGISNQIFRYLKQYAKQFEMDTEHLFIREEKTDDNEKYYHICWESGPYEWARLFCGWEDLLSEELSGEYEFMGMEYKRHNKNYEEYLKSVEKFVDIETNYSFSINIFNN